MDHALYKLKKYLEIQSLYSLGERYAPILSVPDNISKKILILKVLVI